MGVSQDNQWKLVVGVLYMILSNFVLVVCFSSAVDQTFRRLKKFNDRWIDRFMRYTGQDDDDDDDDVSDDEHGTQGKTGPYGDMDDSFKAQQNRDEDIANEIRLARREYITSNREESKHSESADELHNKHQLNRGVTLDKLNNRSNHGHGDHHRDNDDDDDDDEDDDDSDDSGAYIHASARPDLQISLDRSRSRRARHHSSSSSSSDDLEGTIRVADKAKKKQGGGDFLHKKINQLRTAMLLQLTFQYIALNMFGVFCLRLHILYAVSDRDGDDPEFRWSWMTCIYWAVQTTTTIGKKADETATIVGLCCGGLCCVAVALVLNLLANPASIQFIYRPIDHPHLFSFVLDKGYGDLTVGADFRWFQIFYLIISTYFVGNALSGFATLQTQIEEIRRRSTWQRREVSKAMIDEMQGFEHDDKIDQFEFTIASLLQLGKIDEHDTRIIMDKYRQLCNDEGFIQVTPDLTLVGANGDNNENDSNQDAVDTYYDSLDEKNKFGSNIVRGLVRMPTAALGRLGSVGVLGNRNKDNDDSDDDSDDRNIGLQMGGRTGGNGRFS